MTPRENLLKVLRHETPEWVPVCGHCDPYNQPSKRGMDPALAEKLAEVRWGDESTVAFSRSLGLDITDWYGAPVKTRQRKVRVETAGDASERVTTWRTPRGELRQVERFSPDTNLWYTAEHAVKDVGDLPRLASVFADQEFHVLPEGVDAARARRRLIGDDGILLAPMHGTPLGQMVRVHAGVEAVAYLWADARPALHELFGVMEEAHRRYLAQAVTVENDVIVTVDDTSTTTISPAMFEEFCLGYTDRMADAAHAAGRFYFHHSCGLIRGLLGLYRQTKMDAVHAFTIPPMGDVTVAEGRRRLGPRITIGAGLIQLFGSMADRSSVARSIETMFREAAPGDHFALWLAADPDKTMEETAFVAEECKKHQRIAGRRSGG